MDMAAVNQYSQSSIENKLNSKLAVLLAIAPILDPYLLFNIAGFEIKIMDIVLVFIAPYILKEIVKSKKITIFNKSQLFFLLTIFVFFSFISLSYETGNRSIYIVLKSFTSWFILAVVMEYSWKKIDSDVFYRYSEKIVIVATILLFCQFITGILGYNEFFDGKVPFLNLSKTDGWAGFIDPNTGAIRPNSFFQEPSYYGIYSLPVFAYLLYKQELKKALFVFLGLIISTSLISMLIAFSIILFHLFQNILGRKKFIEVSKMFLVILLFAVVLATIYSTFDSAKSIIDYSFNRITNISNDLDSPRIGSTKLRLVGNLSYFNDFPPFHKILGAGANQYTLYFYKQGLIPYSSTIVTIILNYGSLGLLIFLIWVINNYFKLNKMKKVYLIIFLLITFSDNFWFNWYFVYVLTWCFARDNNEETAKR